MHKKEHDSPKRKKKKSKSSEQGNETEPLSSETTIYQNALEKVSTEEIIVPVDPEISFKQMKCANRACPLRTR